MTSQSLQSCQKWNSQRPCAQISRRIIDFSNAILTENEQQIKEILERDNEISIAPLEKFTPSQNKPNHIILTPFRKGPYGSLELNERIRPKKDQPTPILVTKNDAITNLMNGDIGFITNETATFPEKDISLPALMLPPHEKAFALSIHKSQGSEFDHITIILPEEATSFQKELLFTAITRAKKSIQIYGSLETLLTLIKNQKRALSKLSSQSLLRPLTAASPALRPPAGKGLHPLQTHV